MGIGTTDASSEAPLPERIGRYDVVGLLGAGAAASVFLGRDSTLGTDVLIKLLAGPYAADPETRSRFLGGAADLRSLSDDRVVAVLDIGEFEGRPYLVTERIGDETLEDRLTDGRTLGPEGIQWLVDDLGAALVVVHSAGFVHGDITPDHLLIRHVAGREQLVLADFGFVHVRDRSLDVVAASAVVGRAAFGSDWQRILIPSGPHGATALEPAGTEPLAYELRRGLSTDPAERHTSISEWMEVVGDAASDHAVVADSGEHDVPRRPPLVRVAAGALVVLAMLLAFATVTSPSGSNDDPPQQQQQPESPTQD